MYVLVKLLGQWLTASSSYEEVNRNITRNVPGNDVLAQKLQTLPWVDSERLFPSLTKKKKMGPVKLFCEAWLTIQLRIRTAGLRQHQRSERHERRERR